MSSDLVMVSSLLSSGQAQIPDIYREASLASLSCPRPGVDLALLTATHLVEISQGLVVRARPITHSGQVRSTSLTQSGKVKARPLTQTGKVLDLRLVVGELEDWRYLVVREDGVQFLSMESLTLVKEYHGVQQVELGDFHRNGRRLVKLSLMYGEVILTDGDQEYELIDLDILSVEKEEQEGSHQVLDVITARLEQISEAVEAVRADKEAKDKMIEETLTSLVLQTGLDSEVVLGDTETDSETEETSAVTVTVTDHWLKMVSSDRSEVVLGLRLLCVGAGASLASELSLNLQPEPDSERDLKFSSILLSLSGRPASISGLGWELAAGQLGYLVAVLPLSSLVSCSALALSVSYSVPQLTGRLTRTTHTQHIELPTNIFLSSSVQINFGGKEDVKEDIQSFLSLSVTGRAETLKVRTELGSVSRLTEVLEQNKFTFSPSLAAHVFSWPGHVLHHSLVSVSPVSGQQLSLNLTARDFTTLGLLVNLLRTFLPSDVTFTRVNKSSSQL